jgi:hypothetical protein
MCLGISRALSEPDRSFLRAGAVCAALSAVTTFLLWLLPRLYEAPSTFDESVALHANPAYMARWWVNFIHIFFALTSYCALAAALWCRHRMLAAMGLLWFIMWGFTELLGVTINIWAVNLSWRAGFAAADPSSREILRANLQGFSAIWDAMFFLLLVAFLLGTLFFGLAAASGRGLQRLVGVLLLLAAPLTLGILIGGYTSITSLNRVTDWVYPVLQPVSRALMGLWLWQQSSAHLAPGLSPDTSLERTRGD